MGIVQSCCGTRIKEDKRDIDPSFHAQLIEGKIKRLEKYSQLYDVLEQENKNVQIHIDNELYEAQLPLIQDEHLIVNPRSEHNRTFIRLDESLMELNQSIYSPINVSPVNASHCNEDTQSSSAQMVCQGNLQINRFDSENIGIYSNNNEEQIKRAQEQINNIKRVDLTHPPPLGLNQHLSQRPGFSNNGASENFLSLDNQRSHILQQPSNNNNIHLSLPTTRHQMRQSRMMRMQTGAGLEGETQNNRRRATLVNDKYNPNTLHFAYVFASPLVLEVSKGFLVEDKVDEISFKEEFEYIQDALESTNKGVRYSYQLGTCLNMSDVLEQKPLTLHFSGHGFVNERTTFKDIAHAEYYKEVSKKGDILVMEGQEGGNSDLFFAEDLKKLLVCNKTNFKFVVVASCHSERTGKVFQMAGAEHVICVKTEKELNDKAAVTFSKEFYRAVYKEEMSICDAYKLALATLDISRGLNNESKDYLLLVQGDPKTHKCKQGELAEYVRSGEAKLINDPMKLKIVPPNVTSWVPRSLDIYQCIQKLFSDDSRIVQVFGVPGSGKSAILLKAANYLAERGTYPGGIIYANFQGFKNVRKAFMELIDIIETHNENEFKQLDVNKCMDDKQIIDHLNIYIKGGDRMLFVFDNMDELISNDGDRLANYLNKLVHHRKNLRVLFSASVFMDKPLDSFIVKNIKCLNAKKARDLFIKKIPLDEARTRLFTIESMQELETFTLKDENLNLVEQIVNIKIFDLCQHRYCEKHPCKKKAHKSLEDCGKAYLEKHPLFEILNQPLSICLAAFQLKDQSNTITKIYENLIKASQMQSGLDCSLIVSYMSAFQMLKQSSQYALEILYVISQTATGLTKFNLEKLFSIDTVELKKNLVLLEDTSMIVYDAETYIYKVQNIIGKFVEISFNDNPDSRTKYNRMLASFYLDLLTANKQLVSIGDKDLKHLIDITDYYEKNIIKCLNYLVSLRFQGKDEQEYQRNNTSKSQDRLVNKNYAQFIARQLTHNFKEQQKVLEDKKDGKQKRAGFKKGTASNAVNQIVKPLLGVDGFMKFKTFRKKSTLLNDIISPKMSNSQEYKQEFINEVKRHVREELRNEELKGIFSQIQEENVGSQNDLENIDNQIDNIPENIYSDFEQSEDDEDEEEVKKNTNDSGNEVDSNKGNSSSSNNLYREDNTNNTQHQDDTSDPYNEQQKQQQLQQQQQPTSLRNQTKMPVLEVLGIRDSWSLAKKHQSSNQNESNNNDNDDSNNNGNSNRAGAAIGNIQVSSLETLGISFKNRQNTGISLNSNNTSKSSKNFNNSISIRALGGDIIKQPATKSSSSIGHKMFGGLFKQDTTNSTASQPEFSIKFKQIMQVISQNINEKLRKLNDKVTEKEAQQYKQTVNKFSQFIGQMMIKPSEAVNSYINNPRRQWSKRPTSKGMNKQADSQYRKGQSVVGRKDKNDLNSSPPKDTNGMPVEQYGNTLGLGLQKLKVHKQSSKVSVKNSNMNRQISSVGGVTNNSKTVTITTTNNVNNNINSKIQSDMQPPPLEFEQIRSNTNIDEELGFKIEQPDDEFLEEFEIENLSSEDQQTIDDGMGEMQILLYHFMSIQALKNREIKDFINLKNQFLIDQMDPMFQASIDLLLVYQHLKQKTNHQYAAADLENLLKLYNREGSQKGQAIVCFFLAFVFKNIGTFAALDKAKNYLENATELFKLECDEEGVFFCQKLRVMLQPKSSITSKLDKDSNQFMSGNLSIGNFSPSDVRSPTNAQIDGIVMSPRSVSNKTPTQSFVLTNNSFRYKLIKDRESLNLLINPVDLNKQMQII